MVCVVIPVIRSRTSTDPPCAAKLPNLSVLMWHRRGVSVASDRQCHGQMDRRSDNWCRVTCVVRENDKEPQESRAKKRYVAALPMQPWSVVQHWIIASGIFGSKHDAPRQPICKRGCFGCLLTLLGQFTTPGSRAAVSRVVFQVNPEVTGRT